MENEISSYMAGFFDGEGCITITKRIRENWSIEYTLRISIGQKDGSVLDWIVDNFGGKIHKVKRDNSFMWYTSNKSALKVLKMIVHFMKYKRPQAEAAINFYEGSEKLMRPIPSHELERREKIYHDLKTLKKQFTDSYYSNVRRFND